MLGQRIAALRRAADMSQADLAKRLGISPSAVGMYEQGRREPAAAMIVELARLFGVSTDYLLTGACRDAGEEQRFLAAFRTAFETAQTQLDKRKGSPLTRQELAVLVAAMLTEA